MLSVSKSQGTPAISTADMKSYLRIDHSADDTLIASLILSAQDMIERATGLCLTESEITVTWSEFVSPEPLPYALYISGELAGYSILCDYIYGADGEVTFTYKAGFTTPPAGLLSALRTLVAHLYVNRGDNAIPRQVVDQLLPYTRNL